MEIFIVSGICDTPSKNTDPHYHYCHFSAGKAPSTNISDAPAALAVAFLWLWKWVPSSCHLATFDLSWTRPWLCVSSYHFFTSLVSLLPTLCNNYSSTIISRNFPSSHPSRPLTHIHTSHEHHKHQTHTIIPLFLRETKGVTKEFPQALASRFIKPPGSLAILPPCLFLYQRKCASHLE